MDFLFFLSSSRVLPRVSLGLGVPLFLVEPPAEIDGGCRDRCEFRPAICCLVIPGSNAFPGSWRRPRFFFFFLIACYRRNQILFLRLCLSLGFPSHPSFGFCPFFFSFANLIFFDLVKVGAGAVCRGSSLFPRPDGSSSVFFGVSKGLAEAGVKGPLRCNIFILFRLPFAGL